MKTSALPLLIDFFQTIFAGLYSLPCVTIEVSVLLSTQSASDLTETSLNANNKVRKKDFFLKEFLYFYFLFIYLFIFGCVGYSFLCKGFLQLRQAGATLHHGAQASHYCGLSCCRAQAPDAQAQQLWLTGPAAPRHVGSSQTRARTRVPCIGRQILNHCATREVQKKRFYISKYPQLTVLGSYFCL